MPKFKVKFWREVVEIDEYELIIEAPDEDAATERAEELSSEFNMSCPDGVTKGDTVESKSWNVDHDDVETYTGDKEADEVVDADMDEDGCQTCYNAIETRQFPCDECGALDEAQFDEDDDPDYDDDGNLRGGTNHAET